MVNERFGNNTNPPLLLVNLDQHEIHELQKKNNWDSIAGIFINAAKKLQSIGAEAIVFCANTPHKVYEQVSGSLRIPVLHIADATGAAVIEKKIKKVGLIGTLYTMEDDFISGRLKNKYQIETIVPADVSSRNELQRIITEELAMGVFKEKSKQFILGQISLLRQKGAEGIILGCTEFPLIIKDQDVDFPLFNTTYLHCKIAAAFILNTP
jgi:aspartate racemase